MISYDEIRQLQDYPAGPDTRILSIYVNVDQSDAANLNRGFETQVESLFRRMAENQAKSENHKQKFEAERMRILQFLTNYVTKGRALVIFSDSSCDFWWQRDLQVDLPTEGRWSQKPWMRPLLHVLEEHDVVGVVLIDKHRVRLLTIDASGLERHAEVVSDVPNKHATTGSDHIMSQGQMQSDHDEHVKAHARRVADELNALVERLHLTHLVIGGPVEATTAFVGELPKRLQQMIVGTISVSLDTDDERLTATLRSLRQQAEHEDEARAVESLITAAMKGDRATLGLDDTLAAIQEQRVYRLVIARDFRVEGKECSSCHVLTVGGQERCRFCGGEFEPAPDLINRASHRVLEQAGRVQMVSGAAADKLAGAGIGAVLRF